VLFLVERKYSARPRFKERRRRFHVSDNLGEKDDRIVPGTG
jgi:hypothetical protein